MITEHLLLDNCTVNYWVTAFSQSIEFDLNSGENQCMITVEIDESKFEKSKNNRGHKVEEVWEVGGEERTEERKMFAAAVDNSNAETSSTELNNVF